MSTVLSTWASDDFVISRLTIKGALPQGAGELLSLVIVTVSGEMQKRMFLTSYKNIKLHCHRLPYLYMNSIGVDI